jgi:hypothetical protein
MKRKKYLTREEKALDFVIGFVGFLVLNTATSSLHSVLGSLAGLVGGSFANIFGYRQGGDEEIIQVIIIIVMTVLPWVINIGLLAFFAWWRSWIAIGALFAWGFLLMMSILTGICCIAGCLATLFASALLKGT